MQTTIFERAQQLVKDAQEEGQIVTISLEPGQPLAMGHYQMTVDVRPNNYKKPVGK